MLKRTSWQPVRLTWITFFCTILTAISFAQTSAPNTSAAVRITLDDAVRLALSHSHSLKAAQTTVPQAQAQEVTAGLRPNPVLSWDAQFIPIFSPQNFSGDTLNEVQQFDVGVGYLIERGHKRQARLQAARDQTAVTSSQLNDTERTLVFDVAQQFVNAQLADSNLNFALQDLDSFRQTVNIGQERYKVGDISEADFLKIKLQLLQFQTDVSSARVAKVQALASLRQLLGYTAVPENYDVAGELTYQPLHLNVDDLRLQALRQRPDFLAAQQGLAASRSQFNLAKANGKRDLNTTVSYSHVAGQSSASLFFNIDLPIFDRNQGEIARTRFGITQAQETELAASDAVLTDVDNAYAAVRTNDEVMQLYVSGYLKEAQDSRDISQYAYQKGAASLLEFLDAERSYRATQLAYRQALASYALSVEQLKQAVGTRNLP